MNLETLHALKSLLERERFLAPATFGGDMEKVLDERDRDPFDVEWTRAFDTCQSSAQVISEEEVSIIDDVRHMSFIQTYNLTELADWAAAVSDDIGLIATAVARNVSDDWINGLWITYVQHELPRGEVKRVSGDLCRLISM